MEEVKVNTSKTVTLNLGFDPDSNSVLVTLHHEFGDVVFEDLPATRASAGVYTFAIGTNAGGEFILNSSGKYRVEFTYNKTGVAYSRSQFLNVVTTYCTESEFFAAYPELEFSNSEKFESSERRVRAIINTFCGQSFDGYYNKSLTINGFNSKTLHLPLPISTLSKVTMNIGESDETILFDASSSSNRTIEKIKQPFNFESSYYIRFKDGSVLGDSIKFKESASYTIVGDWGWQYVPGNVTEAAKLLIADLLNDDSEYYRHRVTSVDMDAVSFSMKSNFYETTGNIEADVLLTDYTLFVMDYIR